MRKFFIPALLLTLSNFAFSQTTVAIYQSNIPQFGINTQIGEKFLPEARIGLDQYFSSISTEAVINYLFVNKDDRQLYAGLGYRSNSFDGLVIPVGLNVFPFENKKFGFHIELAALVRGNNLLRGSWGIRYKFDKK